MGKVEEGDQFHSESISLCLSSLEECDKPVGGGEGCRLFGTPKAGSTSREGSAPGWGPPPPVASAWGEEEVVSLEDSGASIVWKESVYRM